MSANRNADNFCVPVKALLDQKHRLSSQPVPNANPGLYAYVQVPYSPSVFLFLFLVLYPTNVPRLLPLSAGLGTLGIKTALFVKC